MTEFFVWRIYWGQVLKGWYMDTIFFVLCCDAAPYITGSCPVVTVLIDPQGSPVHCLGVESEVIETNNGPFHWQHVIFGNESRFQLYPIRWQRWGTCVYRLPGERLKQRCQAYRVQAGGASVHAGELSSTAQYWYFAKYLSAIYQTVFLMITTATKTPGKSLITFSRATSPRWNCLQDRQTTTS